MNATVLNPKSKKARHYMDAYARSSMATMFDAYKNPSSCKISICEDLRNVCAKEGGRMFRIISACAQFFTVGWRRPDGSLQVETYANTYIIKPE